MRDNCLFVKFNCLTVYHSTIEQKTIDHNGGIVAFLLLLLLVYWYALNYEDYHQWRILICVY